MSNKLILLLSSEASKLSEAAYKTNGWREMLVPQGEGAGRFSDS